MTPADEEDTRRFLADVTRVFEAHALGLEVRAGHLVVADLTTRRALCRVKFPEGYVYDLEAPRADRTRRR